MQHRIPTFPTSLRTLLVLASMCIVGAVTGTLKAGEFEDNAYRVVSPQVVATSDIETTFILSNPLFRDTCEVRVSYHLGGGTKPGFPILTNGEDLGHDFTIHLEGATFGGDAGFTPLKVTTNGDAFVGATTFLIEPACGPLVRVVTQYLIPGGPAGFENFSSSDAGVVTLNEFADCATFFWKYAAGKFDNGLAIVSDGNPEADLFFSVFSAGTLVDSSSVIGYDGSHRARLISEDLDTTKLSEAGERAFRVCVVSPPKAPISVLALGLVQAGVIQPQAGAIGSQFTEVGALQQNAEEPPEKHALSILVQRYESAGGSQSKYKVLIKDHLGTELKHPDVSVDRATGWDGKETESSWGTLVINRGESNEVRVKVDADHIGPNGPPDFDTVPQGVYFSVTIDDVDLFPDDWSICIIKNGGGQVDVGASGIFHRRLFD